ncbi:MAG: cobalamin biosynthesis protein P47K [Verrucomicrobia bacterium]|nr:cobalamin biosynthesis protein P47K [Verrucomicrobiota bacterium]
MVGGFLGAGKTTAMLRLAEWVARRGLRPGLISNDQGSGLVDTALFAARQLAVEEIPGGCFCCRFNSLVEAARKLTATTRPDLFLAEPVGSCTDLVATVAYPLRQIYGSDFTIAPLSVLVDPVRAARVLGLEGGGKFSEKVLYIYRKQLEEADCLVINKCDLLTAEKRAALRAALAGAFLHARLFEVSARTGEGLEAWFSHLLNTEQQPRAAMDVDYEVYADGEALLGWLNGTVQLSAARPFDANALLQRLAQEIQDRLQAAGAEVAHLKMTLDPRSAFGDLAAVNLVRNDFVPELSLSLPDPVERGELTINLRAEAEPELLRRAVEASVQQAAGHEVVARWQALEAFKPGKPQPTHRVTAFP